MPNMTDHTFTSITVPCTFYTENYIFYYSVKYVCIVLYIQFPMCCKIQSLFQTMKDIVLLTFLNSCTFAYFQIFTSNRRV